MLLATHEVDPWRQAHPEATLSHPKQYENAAAAAAEGLTDYELQVAMATVPSSKEIGIWLKGRTAADAARQFEAALALDQYLQMHRGEPFIIINTRGGGSRDDIWTVLTGVSAKADSLQERSRPVVGQLDDDLEVIRSGVQLHRWQYGAFELIANSNESIPYVTCPRTILRSPVMNLRFPKLLTVGIPETGSEQSVLAGKDLVRWLDSLPNQEAAFSIYGNIILSLVAANQDSAPELSSLREDSRSARLYEQYKLLCQALRTLEVHAERMNYLAEEEMRTLRITNQVLLNIDEGLGDNPLIIRTAADCTPQTTIEPRLTPHRRSPNPSSLHSEVSKLKAFFAD